MVRPSLWTCPKRDGHRENLSLCTSFPVSSSIPYHPLNSQLTLQDSSLTIPLPKYNQSYELTEYLEGASLTVYFQHLCTFTYRERLDVSNKDLSLFSTHTRMHFLTSRQHGLSLKRLFPHPSTTLPSPTLPCWQLLGFPLRDFKIT